MTNPAKNSRKIRRKVILLLPAVLAAAVAVAQDKPAATAPASGPPPGARVIEEGWFPPKKVNRPPLPEEVTNAFVIPIHKAITPTLADIVQRKVIRCKTGEAQLVVFDMDTPGGRSDAMDQIVRMILDDLEGIRTVAYVNPEAFSAGAIISLACDEIAVSPTGVIGDAMPIYMGPQGVQELPDKVRKKFESAMRSQVRVLAKQNGYNVAMCEAMITIDMEIWLIRNRRTRELKIVDAAEWRDRVAAAPGRSAATQPAGGSREWEYLLTIDTADELVTLTGDEAHRYGLAAHVFQSRDELNEHYNVTAAATYLGDTWSERLVRFLTSPVVSSLLFMGAIFFAYVEMHSPGFGIPGALAVACFALMLGSRYLIGMAQWWEVAVLVIGILLILAEILVIPGFGVAGVLGAVFVLAALAAIIIPNAPNEWPIPKTDLDWSVFANGLYALIVAFIGATMAAAVAARYLPKIPLASRLVLASAEKTPEAAVGETSPYRRVSAGDKGTVESTCRPVGKVRIGDDLLDAVSESGIIKAGRKVKVLRRSGNRLVVEEIQEA